METLITLLLLLIIVVAVLYVISIWVYKRAPTNMAFVRTGYQGEKVCIGRGALVLPVFHEVTWVSLETIKLIVRRGNDDAILTADKIRIDVVTELYAHVGHDPNNVLIASRSLGEKTFDADKVRNLLEAKIVSALRSYAATKTLTELHENRDAFAGDIKDNVTKSFQANGLLLEEVTIVTLEQTGKEFFNTDNVFDAEGLKVITEITADARRKVHETEKRTTVSIRQKDLSTQLELFEIEKQEAFARANQDKEIANEQALRIGEKQIYILDQRMTVEQKELDTDRALERLRAERDIASTEEARRRETAEVQKALALEQEKRDRDIVLIAKAREEELANIERNLVLEQAEKDRRIALLKKQQQEELAEVQRSLALEQAEKAKQIELESKERERQQAEIARVTAVKAEQEAARIERHQATEAATLAVRQRSLETKLAALELEKQEAQAVARNEQAISDEQAQALSEKQRFILEQRWQVEQEEISKELALDKARIDKDVELSEQSKRREAAEIQRALAREREQRERDLALVALDEQLERARIQQELALELDQRARDIALIGKEQEREQVDIRRFLAREREERDREIALAQKQRELELAEAERLQATAEREQAEQQVNTVRSTAAADRQKAVERIQAEAQAEATLITARAGSEAQQINALGIEKEAGARGRAEVEVEQLRVVNTRRMFEAEAKGIEAKADALKKYNDAATYLELAKLHIEAERDIHIDQAKAMGSALAGAQIRMYGGEGGTVDTIRGLFTSGFGLGEALEGVAQSLPEGLRQRFADNGLRGIFGRPGSPDAGSPDAGSPDAGSPDAGSPDAGGAGEFKAALASLNTLVQQTMSNRKAREEQSFGAGLKLLEQRAGDDPQARQALTVLNGVNRQGLFDEVSFEKVWALLQAAAKSIN